MKVVTKLALLAAVALALSSCSSESTNPMPSSESDGDEVTLINVFAIPEDEIDVFVEKWKERSRFTTTADGFISAELYRAVGPDMEFQLVNVTKWESAADLEATMNDPEFQAARDEYLSREDSTLAAHRGLYRTASVFD